MSWNKIKKPIIFILLVFTLFVISVKAQESSSLSPTPSPSVSSSTPDIPLINTEALRDPAAFALDQQIKGATKAFFTALEQKQTISELETKASARKNLMKQAIVSYPYVFLGNAIALPYTIVLEDALQSYFEKPVTVSNVELGVVHYDDFENHQNSRYEYLLQDIRQKKQFNFYPVGEFGGHISGTTLSVNGVVLDEDVAARVAAAPPQAGEEGEQDPVPTNVEVLKEASPDAIGPQRVAVILVKTKGATFTPYYTKEQIEEIIFRGDVQKFFKEASYGKMWIDEEKSKVYGWYEVENLRFKKEDKFDFSFSEYKFIKQISTISDSDINFNDFDRIIIGAAMYSSTYGGWGLVGKSTYHMADGDVHLSFSTFGVSQHLIYTVAHELGHNIVGVYHANSWDCDQGGVQGNCEHREYGNPFDVMGSGRLGHFNGYFKEVSQWLNKPVINITSSGRYSLQPLERADAVVAKITMPGADKFPIYYLEARAPVGFDDDTNDTNLITKNKIKGIHVNWVNKPLETRFLTLIPVRKGGQKQTEPLKLGQSFRDEQAGYTITNIDDSTVDVLLEKPLCKYDNLYTEINRIHVYPFDSQGNFSYEHVDLICQDDLCTLRRKKQEQLLLFAFILTVKNNNAYTCPDSHIKAFIDKSPWGQDPKTAVHEKSIPIGEIWYFEPSIMIPPTAQAGTYNISVQVDNVDSKFTIFSTSRDLKIIDEFQILEGDLNQDNKVDIFDLVTVAKDFGKKETGLAADLDKNGVVDIFDLVVVGRNFGKKI